MGRKKQKDDPENEFNFGNIEIPEFDSAIFDIIPNAVEPDETRYTKPKVYEAKPQYILYENADKLAKEKLSDCRLQKCLESTYYRFHKLRKKCNT